MGEPTGRGRGLERGKGSGKREIGISKVRGSEFETPRHIHREGSGIPGPSQRATEPGLPWRAPCPYLKAFPPRLPPSAPVLAPQAAASSAPPQLAAATRGSYDAGLRPEDPGAAQQPPQPGERWAEVGFHAETTVLIVGAGSALGDTHQEREGNQ